MNILNEIIENKRLEIETPGYFQALEDVLENIPHLGKNAPPCSEKVPTPGKIDFVAALKAAPIGLIAEVKRRSPSAGPIREPFDPAAIARAYEAAGAQAISCLMDAKYFGGGEAQWNEVRAATGLPMLYKEFVVDPRQIFHAEALGASAVLLIVAALTDDELRSFIQLVDASGMTPLVEVHTEEEMKRAVDAGAQCIGINNRNLKTFETKIETTLRLRELAPADCILISESGIRTADDIRTLQASGVSAVLVGESLLRQPDIGVAVKNLMI
ncbi:MAG: indole-3-glycerol phosphate synthase TrpC [Verrucomicrobia bacterium]|nr:indole-3-glycerol phosphate synthase TrpC [Verrucomicrobiota bacterium]